MQKRFSYSLIHILILSVIFLITGGLIFLIVSTQMKKLVLEEARSRAQIILDHNIAIHSYFTNQLKPEVFALLDNQVDSSYFNPVWMSSTHAVLEIQEYFVQLGNRCYTYKEGAIDARNPLNEADSLERDFLLRAREDSTLQYTSGVLRFNDHRHFYLIRRGELMEQSCLRCHDQPAQAPQAMRAIYGDQRGFQRKANQLVSVVSVQIPFGTELLSLQTGQLHISFYLILAMLMIFIVEFIFYRRFFLQPVERLKNEALNIITDESRLGQSIELPSSSELAELTEAFNELSANLQKSRNKLEQRVTERTADLRNTNRQLQKEIDQRKEAEEAREKLIAELQKSLQQVKTLSGLIPICASCKKIRDDSGYWDQVESYITKHADVSFTHGLCPDCMKKLYPGFKDESEKG